MHFDCVVWFFPQLASPNCTHRFLECIKILNRESSPVKIGFDLNKLQHNFVLHIQYTHVKNRRKYKWGISWFEAIFQIGCRLYVCKITFSFITSFLWQIETWFWRLCFEIHVSYLINIFAMLKNRRKSGCITTHVKDYIWLQSILSCYWSNHGNV